jgi:Fur family ferric uptake transcriptional regulator
MPSHDEMLTALHDAGHRITPRRRVVLRVIEGSDEHLDAEAIYQRARELDSRISLTTVYRTLTVLKAMGLIEQRWLTRDHNREHYEPVGAAEHYHFTCLGCRQVIEFQSTRIQQMRDELRQELGLQIGHACICLEGYCATCAKERSVSHP